MREIIDVASNIGPFATRLAAAGVKTVIRYYNHQNSPKLPTKCLTGGELQSLFDAGLSIGVVFEQAAGAGGAIDDLSAASGAKDAGRALELAAQLEQPQHSAIYFAVDWDFDQPAELNQIAQYFAKAKETLAGRYLIGVYGSGTIGQSMKDRGLVDHIWLAGSTGWSGFDAMLRSGKWSIFQNVLDSQSEIGTFDYDGDAANPSFDNFGQFGKQSDGSIAVQPLPPQAGTVALFKVVARSGLHLRAGPGANFQIIETVPNGAIITGLGRDGDWIKADLGGDGHVDGYLFANFLDAVSGGLPATPAASPQTAMPRQPIDVARAEMALGVQEVPGPQNNPRIVMYHQTTSGGAAPDETAWCSSFVNYCVEQTGFVGTNSKAALSWRNWELDATAAPQPGDIAVFERRSTSSGEVVGGHVAFFMSQDENTLQLLGGNQENRVCIARYPRNGVLGSFHYQLLSIRRP